MNMVILIAAIKADAAGVQIQYQAELEDGRGFGSAEALIPWSENSLPGSNNIVIDHAKAHALAQLGVTISAQDKIQLYCGRAL